MLLPVVTGAVAGGEFLQEVRIQVIRRARGEPAQARQPVAFQMDLAVASLAIIGFEDHQEMVSHRFVGKFCEAAQAPGSSHVISLL